MDEQQIVDFVTASRREQGLSDRIESAEPFEAVAAILANAAETAVEQRGAA